MQVFKTVVRFDHVLKRRVTLMFSEMQIAIFSIRILS